MSEVKVENKLPDLYAKIHALKSEMGSVKKSSKNPFFKSNYADLNAHLSLLEPLLDRHKLVLTQPTIVVQGANIVLTRITDIESGTQVESSFVLPENTDMQKLGSAITYARRYTLGALLGMRAEDDDGNSASGKGAPKRKVKAVAEDF